MIMTTIKMFFGNILRGLSIYPVKKLLCNARNWILFSLSIKWGNAPPIALEWKSIINKFVVANNAHRNDQVISLLPISITCNVSHENIISSVLLPYIGVTLYHSL